MYQQKRNGACSECASTPLLIWMRKLHQQVCLQKSRVCFLFKTLLNRVTYIQIATVIEIETQIVLSENPEGRILINIFSPCGQRADELIPRIVVLYWLYSFLP